jgi:alkanesulfonate monooxygenase SsuD/methylene tetrahydromethanopterin reductase-like flavin-dependent oxidoreductase (luciferase family)
VAALGVCFAREFPAGLVTQAARTLEHGGVDDLWVIEDCFYTTGVTLAAAALSVTDRLAVGLGILPAVSRNAAVTAMEFATLAELASGRVVAGIGHGVQEWMEQMGARTPSPVTTLREVLLAVRALLRGETVSTSGREVTLSEVRLEHPPSPVPPVLAGVRGPRSVAMAGTCADGLVLAEGSGPDYVRWAREWASPPGGFEVAVFSFAHIDRDRAAARRRMAPAIARTLAEAPQGLRMAPFFDELSAFVRARGVEGVLAMPDDWWPHVGAIGTPDDAVAHVDLLSSAGADRVSLSLGTDFGVWQQQVARICSDLVPAFRG